MHCEQRLARQRVNDNSRVKTNGHLSGRRKDPARTGSWHHAWGGAMSEDSELIALIDVIYAAVLDGDLWPTVLAKLADATGALQAVIGTLDRRTDTYASISRRA